MHSNGKCEDWKMFINRPFLQRLELIPQQDRVPFKCLTKCTHIQQQLQIRVTPQQLAGAEAPLVEVALVPALPSMDQMVLQILIPKAANLTFSPGIVRFITKQNIGMHHREHCEFFLVSLMTWKKDQLQLTQSILVDRPVFKIVSFETSFVCLSSSCILHRLSWEQKKKTMNTVDEHWWSFEWKTFPVITMNLFFMDRVKAEKI